MKNENLRMSFRLILFPIIPLIDSFPFLTSPHWASLVAQLEENPPAMQETLVRFLGREDPLEKEEAAHCSVLAWRIP